MRENNLVAQLKEKIINVSIPEIRLEKMLAKIDVWEKEQKETSASFLKKLDTSIKENEKQLDRLVNAFLDGTLDKEIYLVKKDELLRRKTALFEKKKEFKQKGQSWFEPLREFVKTARGSVLVEFGDTRVLCNVTAVAGVPPFLDPAVSSWLTSEYAMLPASTGRRKPRERGKADARSLEIQRLIGRSLRHSIDLKAFAGMTLYVDCDVLQADGGTRTAAVSGAWVALYDAVKWLQKEERLFRWPLIHQVAAVSVGIIGGKNIVDLDYKLDSIADFDLNLVMNELGSIVEIQGTAEKGAFSKDDLDKLLVVAKEGIENIIDSERNILKDVLSNL